jgi:hypothetical protein
MPITYQYESDAKIIRAKATEIVTTKEILDYVTNIIEDITIEKGFIEVVDFELVRDVVVTYSELDPFPNIWEKYMKKGCKATVIYAPTDLSYGTIRMLQTVVSISHEVAEDLFIVVRSKDELENKLTKMLA